MKAINVDEVLKILHTYGKYIFVTDEKRYSSMVDEISNLKALEQEPCEDMISRQVVLDMQYRIDDSATLSSRDVVNVDDIENLPPVIPQQKIGHWIYKDEYSELFEVTYECSCCKRVINVPFEAIDEVYKDYPYCHCGVKMIDPQGGEE